MGNVSKIPENGFKWAKNLSKFNETFIRNYDKNSDIGYFLEVDIDYLKNYLIFIKICCFYLKEKK